MFLLLRVALSKMLGLCKQANSQVGVEMFCSAICQHSHLTHYSGTKRKQPLTLGAGIQLGKLLPFYKLLNVFLKDVCNMKKFCIPLDINCITFIERLDIK